MEKLRDVLPDIEQEIVDIKEEDSTCILRVRLREESDALEWLRCFQQRSKTQWIVRQKTSSNADVAKRYVFNKDYLCHHSDFRKVRG